MTEAEWLAFVDPEAALRVISARASARKWQLLACACVRSDWDMLSDLRSRNAIEVSERFADGEATAAALSLARSAAFSAAEDLQDGGDDALYQPAARLLWAVSPDQPRNQRAVERHVRAFPSDGKHLVMDVFGNPFRPVVFDSSWRTETVVALAAGIYADRAFDRLPVLADALDDAGCTHPDLLAHCRAPGPHVRGCWAVDLLLGKA